MWSDEPNETVIAELSSGKSANPYRSSGGPVPGVVKMSATLGMNGCHPGAPIQVEVMQCSTQ
jgi:hypothetical protein